MPEGFGADAADAGVPVAVGGDLRAALGLDAGEVEFLAEDVGEFFEGDVDFEDVLAGLFAALPASCGRPRSPSSPSPAPTPPWFSP